MTRLREALWIVVALAVTIVGPWYFPAVENGARAIWSLLP